LTTSTYSSLGVLQSLNPRHQLLKVLVYHSATSAVFLQVQCAFQEKDKVTIDGEKRALPFLNIFNQGFKVKMAAWAEGQQLALKPDFAKSYRRFNK
jgi:hypothetical protein